MYYATYALDCAIAFGPKEPPMPRRIVDRITIPLPDPDVAAIITQYARIKRIDTTTAAEHLITFGARAWLRQHRGGKNRSRLETPDERSARARLAAETRWAKTQVRPSPEPPIAGPNES